LVNNTVRASAAIRKHSEVGKQAEATLELNLGLLYSTSERRHGFVTYTKPWKMVQLNGVRPILYF